MKVADAIWVSTALLHKEKGIDRTFKIRDIVQCAVAENLAGGFRGGLQPHASSHCVANKPPNPGRYRMLYRTGPQRRRLFREGDDYDRAREGGKTTPVREDLPLEYQGLLDWYRNVYSPHSPRQDEPGRNEAEADAKSARPANRKVLIGFPGELLEKAQRIAEERGIDRGELIRTALEEFVSKAEHAKVEHAMAAGYVANADLDKQVCDDFTFVDRENLG